LERLSGGVSLPLLPTLDKRVENLPFDILPGCIDWQQLLPNNNPVKTLIQEIPFQFDTIVTRNGASVKERRGTAWIAEPEIGALAYSGKLMPPRPISPLVRQVMTQVEQHVLLDGTITISSPFFDCALCNHYPDGDSACKFHTDPEHGSHWERLTCVVAAGSPRKFAFRPIPQHSQWTDWENGDHNAIENAVDASSLDGNVPAVITLFPGDVVKMFGSCNDDFHHAVYPGTASSTGPNERVSLVLKRAISRNGRKGHGMAGEGRRSRRQRSRDGG